MNKKILMLLVSVLAVAMLTVPVMAKPTKGQKSAVTITMVGAADNPIILSAVPTGSAVHIHMQGHYYVTIEIAGGSTLEGEAFLDRKLLVVPQPNRAGDEKWHFTDYYVITIHTIDEVPVGSPRGFEGNGRVMIEGATTQVLAPWIQGRSNALFHGTGAFEGQTLNFNTNWRPFGGGIVWDGYLLKV